MIKILKSFLGTRLECKSSDLVPRGIRTTVIPSTFIDGNKNPVWENNHKLLINSKKETFQVW